jgi:D-amino-acid dehydrogenase
MWGDMKVVVVGAGIVGLATAYELALAGHSVRIVDSHEKVGLGASGANGAQLSYSYVQPLADPSLWLQLPKLLFEKNSPLKWVPSRNMHQWRWLAEFAAACTQNQSHLGTQSLLTLAALSRQRLEAMMLHLRVEKEQCDFQANGKLVLYRSLKGFSMAQRQLDFQQKLPNSQAQIAINAAKAMSIEPALEGAHHDLVGAIHTPSECVINCGKLCDLLAERLSLMGVEFCMAQTLVDLPGLAASQTDVYWVICAGSQSYEIAKSFGVWVPVYPLKGYSVTVPVRRGAGLKVSITDASRKIVCAPLGNAQNPAIRIAGYAELVGMDRQIAPSKIHSLLASVDAIIPKVSDQASRRFAHESDWSRLSPWAGLRPATPTGIPIIGHVAGLPKNVLVNTGQGALGLTLAFGSAYRLRQIFETLMTLEPRRPAAPPS